MDTITLCVERMEARSELLLRSGKRIAGRAETQASQCPACPDACLLLQLPEEILERVLLSTSTKEDLCTFAAVCKKFQRLCVREDTWRGLFSQTYGNPSQVTTDAAKLAGSWKALFKAKRTIARAAEPWLKPSAFEVTSAIRHMCIHTPIVQGLRTVTVVFLIDGSGSVNPGDFAIMSSFVVETAEAVCKAHKDAKLGVVQFSSEARVELAPQAWDRASFGELMSNMGRMNGGTNFAIAIQKAGQLLKDVGPCTARILVMLTDGRVDPYQGREAVEMAERLVDEQGPCVSIWGFGVGRSVDKTELEKIINVCGPKSADNRYLALCTNEEAPW